VGPAEAALKEIELCGLFCAAFPMAKRSLCIGASGLQLCFTTDAARDLVKLFTADRELRDILERTGIWASEEVILQRSPPFSVMKSRRIPAAMSTSSTGAPYTLAQIDAAFSRQDVYWIHPVPRIYDDPIRKHVRERLSHYENPRCLPGPPFWPRLRMAVPLQCC